MISMDWLTQHSKEVNSPLTDIQVNTSPTKIIFFGQRQDFSCNYTKVNFEKEE